MTKNQVLESTQAKTSVAIYYESGGDGLLRQEKRECPVGEVSEGLADGIDYTFRRVFDEVKCDIAGRWKIGVPPTLLTKTLMPEDETVLGVVVRGIIEPVNAGGKDFDVEARLPSGLRVRLEFARDSQPSLDRTRVITPIVRGGPRLARPRIDLPEEDEGQEMSREAFRSSLQQISPDNATQVKQLLKWLDPDSGRGPDANDDVTGAVSLFRSEAARYQARLPEIESELAGQFSDIGQRVENWLAGEFVDRLRTEEKLIRDKVQLLLDHLAGHSFGSLEQNQTVAKRLQSFMNRLGLRVLCPKEDCRRPAYLRCAAAGRTRAGAFRFEHRNKRRHVYHGVSVVLPRLQVVFAPFSLKGGRHPS